jgi:hypothetical protein
MVWRFRKLARLLPALSLFYLPTGLRAPGVWNVMLTIQPFPSPYYSDWQANPNIGSLTVMNNTGSAGTVQIYFTITDQMNRVVVSGTSDPQTIAAGAIKVYDSPYQVAGSATHDARIERIASRTGRLPEGSYTACAAAADESGFVLAQSCADFSIAYPDPPELLGPDDGADLTDTSPLFQWTPVQVPAGYQLTYDLRIVEVLPGQLPSEALRSNIPVYEDLDAMGTVLRYPVEALPLEPGKTYAWSVQALDQNGYPASANEGRSEIRTFEVSEPTVATTTEGATTLTLESASSGGPNVSVAKGLGNICILPDSVPHAITLPVDLPGVFGGGQGNQVIFQDTVTFYRAPANGDWAIVTQQARLSYLLYGRCDPGTGPLGGLRWIAVRRTGRLGDLMDGVPITPTPASQLALRFGVVIFSFTSTTTQLPESFTRARDFLDYDTIDVKPGVNVFGVVDLKEHKLWQLFQALGYTDKYVELQGFLGLDASWSVGGRFAHTPKNEIAGEVSAQRTLLWLRAALPKKQPLVFKKLFATSQVGLEFTVQDSTAYGISNEGTESRAALDLILSANLTLTTPSGVEWHGSIGVDATQEHRALAAYAKDKATKSDSAKKETPTVKYVLKLGVDKWQPLTKLPVHLNDVELEADLNGGFLNMLAERSPGFLDWSVVGTAGFGVGNQDDLGKIILGFGRSADSVQAAATPAEIAAQPNSPPMGPAPRPSGSTRPPRRPKTRRPPGEAPEPPQAAARDQAPRKSQPKPIEPAKKTSGKLQWGVRIALGNMSLGDLIRLIARSRQ